MANPFIFFIRCVVFSRDRESKMAVNDLFTKFSYRYSSEKTSSPLNALWYLKSAIALLFKNKPLSGTAKTGNFGFAGTVKTRDGWQEYLALNGEQVHDFMFRDLLYNELGLAAKLLNLFYQLLLFVVIFPVTLFKKDKSKPSLILLELTELLLLATTLRKHKAKEIFILAAYEKDIVFICYFLKKNLGLKITIVPSSNPISFYYKQVICDTFIFTAPFQKKEFLRLEKNWLIQETKSWPPYAFNAIKLNSDLDNKGPFSVGFVSSGMALREYLGFTNSTDKKDYKAEAELISSLKRLQDEHQISGKIIVYLHPLEKSNGKNLEFSKKYYENVFKEYELAPLDKPSKQCFDLCSVALSGFSSAQIERLFGGYKTLFAPMGFIENYFGDETLDRISVQNYSELKSMITKLKTMSDTDFFEEYGLQEYRLEAYRENQLKNSSQIKINNTNK